MTRRLLAAGLLLVAQLASGCSENAASPNRALDGGNQPRLALSASDITVSLLSGPSGTTIMPQAVSAAGYIYGADDDTSGQWIPYVWSAPYDQPANAIAPQGFIAGQGGVNDYGEASGQINSSTSFTPGYWTPGTGGWTFIPVSTGGIPSVTIKDINNSREIVGFRSGSAQLALYWSSPIAEPVILPLPAFSGTLTGANTQAINNAGDIVGYAVESKQSGKHSTATYYHAVLWHRDAAGWHASMLPTLSATDDRAYDINDAGQIAGISGGGAALWTATNGVYSGRMIVASQGALSKIDRCGRVIGYATSTRSGGSQAWIWDDGSLINLPNPAGVSGTSASAITTELSTGAGIIVGRAYTRSSSMPVRWALPGCPP